MSRHALITALLTGIFASVTTAEKFSIVVIPDTQTEMVETYRYGDMEKWPSMVDWIAAKKDSLNIKFICHVGDLVNWETPYSDPPQFQYQAASDGFDVIDAAGLDYAIAVGNHDTRAVGGKNPDGTACWCGGGAGPGDVKANLRITETLNSFFPPERYKACQGRYDDTTTDNAYHIFSAGGLDWLVLNIELDPRQEMLDWANGIIEDYPNHNVIWLTHNYLAGSGEFMGGVGYGSLTPQQVWDGCIKLHSNMRFVFSGHTCCNSRRIHTGDNGNEVYEMLTDWQGENAGWLRWLEIDTESGTVEAKTYTPYLDEYKTDNENDFILTDVAFVPAAEVSVKAVPQAGDIDGILQSGPGILEIYSLSGTLLRSRTTGAGIWDIGNIMPGCYFFVHTGKNGNKKTGKMAVSLSY